MIVAREFWLSSPWLLVMLLELQSLHQWALLAGLEDRRQEALCLPSDSCSQIVMFLEYLVPSLWEILTPPLRDIHQWHALIYIKWSNISLQNIRLVYTLTNYIYRNHPNCCTIVFRLAVFSIITLIKFNRF